jgi:hypothetical protein
MKIVASVVCLAAVLAAGYGVRSSGDASQAEPQRANVASSSRADSCRSPYAASSPWNVKVGQKPTYASGNPARASLAGTLTSDPTQYTYPVYTATPATPRTDLTVRGTYSNVYDRGRSLARRRGPVTLRVRLPADAQASAGSDGQVIVVEPATGDEWGFWQLARDAAGAWRATNGYHYNTRWSGVPPHGFGSRGAGVPYLAGLVRPCEIARGRIDHALALAYDYPSPDYVYPATKSDGRGRRGTDLPEGTRLQLDPTITAATLAGWHCTGACLTVARALQTYGMYVIDNGGHEKVMFEDDHTAHWGGAVKAKTTAPIPLSAFDVVVDTPPVVRALASSGRPGHVVDLRYTVFDGGGQTSERVEISLAERPASRFRTRLHDAQRNRTYTARWNAPRRLPRAARFCVTSSDPGGHVSAPSCNILRRR